MQWLIDIIIAAILPPGMIMLWHGTAATVPDGWHICNGDEGTPDLQARFIRSARHDLAPGTIGGDLEHVHTFTGDGHSHTIVGGDEIAAGADYEALTSLSVGSGTTDSKGHLPKYHTLWYIMKL